QRDAHKLPPYARLASGPYALHLKYTLAQKPPAGAKLRPVFLHFLGVPAAADAEEEPPAREHVERRDLLRGGDRVALDEEADAAPDLEPRGDGGRGRERDEEVVRVPVLPGQDRPPGPRARPRDGDGRVRGQAQRLVAALLGGARQVVDAHRVVGGEHHDAVVHRGSLCRGAGGVKAGGVRGTLRPGMGPATRAV